MNTRTSFTIKLLVLSIFLALPLKMVSQTGLPDVTLTSIDGKIYNLKEFENKDKVTIVIFWATWCKPCINELDNISDYYEDWIIEADFNLVSVCIDDSRTSSTVKSFVRGRDWQFPVLIDENQDLKRSMSVTDIPFYCLLDKKGNIVKRHTGYLPGDEEFMFEEILEYSNEN